MISAQKMTTEDVSVVNRSKRPKDSKFKQQALPAWQPILTAGTVLPTFFVIGRTSNVTYYRLYIISAYTSEPVFRIRSFVGLLDPDP
jgi:hypothetical protein